MNIGYFTILLVTFYPSLSKNCFQWEALNTGISFYKKRLIRNTSQVHFCNKKRSLKQTSHFKNLRNATKNS